MPRTKRVSAPENNPGEEPTDDGLKHAPDTLGGGARRAHRAALARKAASIVALGHVTPTSFGALGATSPRGDFVGDFEITALNSLSRVVFSVFSPI